MVNRVTARNAKVIAENFLRQHHSISDVKEPMLEGDTWVVEVNVSLPEFKKFHVRVNTETGTIEGY